MVRDVPFCLLVLLYPLTFLSDINAYPRSDFLKDGDDLEQEIEDPLQPFDWLDEERENFKPRREEVLQKVQEILGIRSQSDNLTRRKVPPQFMMELYNTISDSSGVMRGQNPYNAKVVRSFVEKDHFFNTTSSHFMTFYYFNVSRLETNESVLEAELHLYRKKTPSKNFASPYYLIRVYQVLNDRSFDMPDLHRLLNVRYISAHVSGWQVFNVKQAVLGWISGEPNLGLLVTVQDLFEDKVSIEFLRWNEHYHGKQPILVLFNDGRNLAVNIAPHYYAYGNRNNEDNAEENAKSEKIDLENKYDNVEYYRKYKRHHEDGQLEGVVLVNRREPEFFQRQKKIRTEENDDLQELHETSIFDAVAKRRRGHRDVTSSRKRSARIVSHDDAKITRVLTSMDIYERAAFRERLGQIVRDRSLKRSLKQQHRSPRSVGSHNIIGARQAEMNRTNDCTRHELYVNFRNIGLSSSIIAPPGYSAYQCKGVCEPPLSQDQRPTNHATIQAIVHKLGLVEGVQRPCCVPTKLLRTSILFYDDNENVVLKMYDDMIVDSCGCR